MLSSNSTSIDASFVSQLTVPLLVWGFFVIYFRSAFFFFNNSVLESFLSGSILAEEVSLATTAFFFTDGFVLVTTYDYICCLLTADLVVLLIGFSLIDSLAQVSETPSVVVAVFSGFDPNLIGFLVDIFYDLKSSVSDGWISATVRVFGVWLSCWSASELIDWKFWKNSELYIKPAVEFNFVASSSFCFNFGSFKFYI